MFYYGWFSYWLLLSETLFFSTACLAERRPCGHSAPCGSLPRLCDVSPLMTSWSDMTTSQLRVTFKISRVKILWLCLTVLQVPVWRLTGERFVHWRLQVVCWRCFQDWTSALWQQVITSLSASILIDDEMKSTSTDKNLEFFSSSVTTEWKISRVCIWTQRFMTHVSTKFPHESVTHYYTVKIK